MPVFENRGSYLFVKITEPYSLKLTFSFLAVVARRNLIDLTTENVVANRSGRIKVFHEMESALKWLEVDG